MALSKMRGVNDTMTDRQRLVVIAGRLSIGALFILMLSLVSMPGWLFIVVAVAWAVLNEVPQLNTRLGWQIELALHIAYVCALIVFTPLISLVRNLLDRFFA